MSEAASIRIPDHVVAMARALAARDCAMGLSGTEEWRSHLAEAEALLGAVFTPGQLALAESFKTLEPMLRTLPTQDNRCTMDPIFVIKAHRRLLGFDADYTDAPIWYNAEEDREAEGEELEKLKQLYDDEGEVPDGWIRTGANNFEVDITSCFTEAGCKAYLQRNGHNLRHYHGEPWIYADSLYRNAEMTAIRQALLNAVRAEHAANPPQEPA